MDLFLQQSRSAFRNLYGLEQSAVSEETSFELARRNRVLGLWADMPVSEQWTRAVYGQTLHAARLSEELSRIVDALNRSVQGLCLVKGPALAEQAWPREGLRCFDDLDFRCEKNSLPALVDGLSALGYQVKARDDAHRDNLWHFGWGLEFRHSDGMMVEFNHRMFPPHFPWPGRLTRRSPELWEPLTLGQASILCPTPSLHLLLACSHAAWHGWERLGWMVDIAGLLIRHPDVLTAAQALAPSGSFLSNALHCGCAIASKIFGPLPGVDSAGTECLTSQALELLVRDEPDVPVQVQREIHHQLMSSRERAVYTARRFATPGDPDFTSCSLPRSLNSLYWVARPVRYLHGRMAGKKAH